MRGCKGQAVGAYLEGTGERFLRKLEPLQVPRPVGAVQTMESKGQTNKPGRWRFIVKFKRWRGA